MLFLLISLLIKKKKKKCYRIKREGVSKKLTTCTRRVGKDWSEDGGTEVLLDG
jgi:hypothetical protein